MRDDSFGHSAGALVRGRAGRPRKLEAQQKRTDAAVKVLERSIADLDQSTSAVSSGAAAMRQLNQLDEVLRPQVRARSLAWSAAEQLYTQLEGLRPLRHRHTLPPRPSANRPRQPVLGTNLRACPGLPCRER